MADAKRDQNRIPTLLGASSADGVTPIVVLADPTTHALKVEDNTTGTDFGRNIASGDQNNIPVLMAVSSADGVTPVEVYADLTGMLLIDST